MEGLSWAGSHLQPCQLQPGIQVGLDLFRPGGLRVDPDDGFGAAEPNQQESAILQGVLVAILNPKTALFFFAFLPQFTDSSEGSFAVQLLILGCLFALMAIVTDSLYALLAGTIGQRLKGARPFLRIQRYLAGTVFIGLGVMAALGGTKNH